MFLCVASAASYCWQELGWGSYLPAPVDRGTLRDRLQRTATAPDVQQPPSRFTPAARLSAFSPSIPLATTAPAHKPVVAEARQAGRRSSPSPHPLRQCYPRRCRRLDPDARYKLVLDIQQQLKRVGCYWGRMDGSSREIGTKDAMKDFTNRVNATLPLDQPDYVRLTLNPIARRPLQRVPSRAVAVGIGALRCGPPITAQAKQTDAPQAATPQKEVLPWKATSEPGMPGGEPLFKPVPTTVVSTEPLPGRMAIGDPVDTSGEVPQSASSVPAGSRGRRPRSQRRRSEAAGGHKS